MRFMFFSLPELKLTNRIEVGQMPNWLTASDSDHRVFVGNTALIPSQKSTREQRRCLLRFRSAGPPKAKVALFHDAYLAFAASHDFWSFAMNRWNAASPRSGRSKGSF